MRLLSADNNTIGAWFIFSEKIYRELPYPPPENIVLSHPRRKLIPSALRRAPTILYLHGNTGTRAHFLRTSFYTTLTARLGANVLSVDYRGYGDSEGKPTVQGVSRDARAAWNYRISQGADLSNVVILGHSLGTAIASILSSDLSREGIRPRGTVLMAVSTLAQISTPRA
jgi:abhydrolase domain-containing protein 12